MMGNDIKATVYDVDNDATLTRMLGKVLNSYPGLDDEEIRFSLLSEDGGLAWFPTSGAVIESETKTILGDVFRTCLYPFIIVVRVAGPSEARRKTAKEWLDGLGRWLEAQKFFNTSGLYDVKLTRTTPAYLDGTEANHAENWVIAIQLKYKTYTQN